MKILITGATGFIGRHVVKSLIEKLNISQDSAKASPMDSQFLQLVIVTRNQKQARQILMNSESTQLADIGKVEFQFIEKDLNHEALSSNDFKGVSTIIHLLGESIDGRWTEIKKSKIMNSRTQSAMNLLINLPESIETILLTSAVGFYGDRSNELLNEDSSAGKGFLAETCIQVENIFQTYQSNNPKLRLCILRLGVVLSKSGGALKKMLPLFANNLGANLGHGQQWMSWISLQDVVKVILQAIGDQQFYGIINLVHSQTIQNQDFTKKLCRELHTLQWPSVPQFLLKLLMGEMSDLVLVSQKVDCVRLKKMNYQFLFSSLEEFFKLEFSKSKSN